MLVEVTLSKGPISSIGFECPLPQLERFVQLDDGEPANGGRAARACRATLTTPSP